MKSKRSRLKQILPIQTLVASVSSGIYAMWLNRENAVRGQMLPWQFCSGNGWEVTVPVRGCCYLERVVCRVTRTQTLTSVSLYVRCWRAVVSAPRSVSMSSCWQCWTTSVDTPRTGRPSGSQSLSQCFLIILWWHTVKPRTSQLVVEFLGKLLLYGKRRNSCCQIYALP